MSKQNKNLAINGGIPAVKEKLTVWPQVTDEEKAAALRVLDSNCLNYWKSLEGIKFEEECAEYFGVKEAMVVANGGAALQAAVGVLDLQPDDEVIVTPVTFIATAFAVLYSNAIPVFADVKSDLTIDPESIIKKITPNTKAIIPVHINGQPADMDKIMEIAEEYNLKVIEDCAQAHGAEYKGEKVGSIGHIGCFSFCQNKIITTGGEGGLITTNDPDLAILLRQYKDYGATKAGKNEEGRWIVPNDDRVSAGYNLRLSNMQCAIGREGMKHLDEYLAKRRRNAQILIELTEEVRDCFIPIKETINTKHAYWFLPCHINLTILGVTINEFIQCLAAEGIPTMSAGGPAIYLNSVFTDMKDNPKYAKRIKKHPMAEYREGICPVAEKALKETLRMDVNPSLTELQMEVIAKAVIKVVKALKST